MKFIGKVKNGNYWKCIADDGTLIKFNHEDKLIPEYPDSMDVKITNKCDMGCKFCHENSLPNGEHGDIMNAKFIETLLPYTELAIGGGNPLEHPDLIPFLEKCKKYKLIPNMTVNQKHFIENYDLLAKLIENKLIYGLGVSLTNPDQEHFIELIQQFPTAVIHVINGVHSVETLKKLYDKNLKLLILGYKDFRRGENYHNALVDNTKQALYNELPELVNHFDVVSFDNLALKQLEPKRMLTDNEWNQTYMGEDGNFTCFIDLVKNTYSTSSTTPENERKALLDDIKPMFNDIRRVNNARK
jgi:MoaA/NifB/PqqE/SkfB family radical SAM enzyme